MCTSLRRFASAPPRRPTSPVGRRAGAGPACGARAGLLKHGLRLLRAVLHRVGDAALSSRPSGSANVQTRRGAAQASATVASALAYTIAY